MRCSKRIYEKENYKWFFPFSNVAWLHCNNKIHSKEGTTTKVVQFWANFRHALIGMGEKK